MISVNRQLQYGEVFNEVRCLSTDTKPVKDIKNGSILCEIDTGDEYMFDASSRVWHKRPAEGGGTSMSPIIKAEIAKFIALIAPSESTIATDDHAAGTYLVYDGKLCKVTSPIASGETITVGTNVTETTVAAELTAMSG